MLQKRFFVLLYPVFLSLSLFSQYEGKHAVSAEALFSTGENLPFWLAHNQSGKYGEATPFTQLLELQTHNRLNRVFQTGIDLKFGSRFIVTHTNNFQVHFNELYGGIHFWKLVKLEGGIFREEEYLSGLSSTNRNLDRTLNARPYPKIRFSTDGFVNPFFWKEWLSVKAEYDEGWLDDLRHVMNTHLHHKALYLKFTLKEGMNLTAGLNHFVQWGGTHPVYGKLPGIESYWLYVTGKPGDSTFIGNDILNASGNQFGSYYLQWDLSKPAYDLIVYLSHPFDDKSGMEGDNWRDNLIGVFIDGKRKAFLEKGVYEFLYTLHQSGDTHEYGYMRGRDNYYNHSVYNSGFTYRGYTLCTPLFGPMNIRDGKVIGIENTRIVMHHAGLMGSIGDFLKWEAMLTYTYNMGTYDTPYTPPKNQFSSLLSLYFTHPKFPVDLSFSTGADLGELYTNQVGARLSISKTF
ncbi:MAG TPA: capsule assembly Wzi family protein [Prolixibacteraceae bacterium]|nr:capsule assembly Wzi family protein [Prolixibacteraceae bacterium]